VKLAREIQQKQARKRKAEGRFKLRTRREWIKLAQFAFNRYIRIRDDALPCVSCGRLHQGQWHAGHYLSTGARPELRFEPDNVHKQCQPCNTHLSGNIALYRAELCRRIGVARVEELEADQAPRKYTVDDLIEIESRYKRLAKELQNSREQQSACP